MTSARNRHRSLAIQRVDNTTPRKNERTSLFAYFLGGAKSTNHPEVEWGLHNYYIGVADCAVVGYVLWRILSVGFFGKKCGVGCERSESA